jgi:hypothetical protein
MAVMHRTTPELVEQIKAALAMARAAEGKAPKNVYLATIPDEVGDEFLYTTLDYGDYLALITNPQYQKLVNTEPENAERYFERTVLLKTVLWPNEFDPTKPEALQPYPAGVIPTLFSSIMYATGFTDDHMPDVVFAPPTETPDPTPEELQAVAAAHPLASRPHFALFDHCFYVREHDPLTDQLRLHPTLRVWFTQADRVTYKAFMQAQQTGDAAGAIDALLAACVVWPSAHNWAAEVGAYPELLADRILERTGFDTGAKPKLQQV